MIPDATLAGILNRVAEHRHPARLLPEIAHTHHMTLGALRKILDQHGYPDPRRLAAAAARLTAPPAGSGQRSVAGQTHLEVPVAHLRRNPSNRRTNLDGIDDLADSIATSGLLQPIVARRHDGHLVIVAGHRRHAALVRLGWTTAPVLVLDNDLTPATALTTMLVENCHREDFNAIERAEAYGKLRDDHGYSVEDIARRTSVSASTVNRYLTLLELPADEREKLRDGHTTTQHATSLVRAARQADRRQQRPTGGPIGRPKGRKTTPYFSDAHPLAAIVRAMCNHNGKPKVGKVGCGGCWEQAIRDNERTPAGATQ